MRRILAGAVAAVLVVAGSAVGGLRSEPPAVAQPVLKPANMMCPVYREPIDPGVAPMVIDDTPIGFKTIGARREFNTWKEARKRSYAKRIRDGAEWGDPYTLANCPVSGSPLSQASVPVKHIHEGRQFTFCHAGCLEKFQEDPAPIISKVDAEIIKDQAPLYPLSVCLVSGTRLAHVPGYGVDLVYRNRHVRLCHEGCMKELAAHPEKYLPRLDKAIMDDQLKTYPLEHCLVVPGDPIDEDGDPFKVVLGNRLVLLCCENCETSLMARPNEYLSRLDKARAR
ncbi:MAG: hypothetical protein KF866_09715 [Phycisphaeraceae bacterium]|nr:hypothetical protein [Phycisphaeraceae bacterium]MCW5754776.1 hypothetical protein [Phycisphaeraceae bacterium]